MSLPHLAFMLLICLVWGFTFVAGKAGVVEFPPIFFTGLRYILLMLVLLPFLRWHKGQMLAIFGVSLAMGSVLFAFFYLGMASANKVSAVAVVAQMAVPFSTLLSIVWLHEAVGWRRWGGIVLACAGVAVIGFDPDMLSEQLAVLFVLASALANAVGLILMKRLQDIGVFDMQAWIATFSWPILLAVSFLVESGQGASLTNASWIAWGGVAYTALVSSLIGHTGIYYLLQRYDVSLISPLTLLGPVFGIMFGVTVWGDELSARFVLGAAITLAGVLVIALRRKEVARAGASL